MTVFNHMQLGACCRSTIKEMDEGDRYAESMNLYSCVSTAMPGQTTFYHRHCHEQGETVRDSNHEGSVGAPSFGVYQSANSMHLILIEIQKTPTHSISTVMNRRSASASYIHVWGSAFRVTNVASFFGRPKQSTNSPGHNESFQKNTSRHTHTLVCIRSKDRATSTKR